jgi:chitosanase
MIRRAATYAILLATTLATTWAAPKRTIQTLTSIFENSSLDLQYTYVANIGDQRGWTFGFPGFTSGTYSGTFFLEEYRRQRRNNPLNRFLPTFRRIDAGPHDREGRNPDTSGLEEFPDVFRSLGADPKFRRAQHILVNRLAWRPALRLAERLGTRQHITLGQLYDAYVNHGEDGINRLIRRTNRRAGGTPADGVNENAWLKTFLQTRFRVLRADPVWTLATDRIRVYERLLRDRNVRLRTPMKIDCYNNHFELR